jgi:hypothetical protein
MGWRLFYFAFSGSVATSPLSAEPDISPLPDHAKSHARERREIPNAGLDAKQIGFCI